MLNCNISRVRLYDAIIGYDDRAVVFERCAPRFNIYRAGGFGCIIQTLEE